MGGGHAPKSFSHSHRFIRLAPASQYLSSRFCSQSGDWRLGAGRRVSTWAPKRKELENSGYLIRRRRLPSPHLSPIPLLPDPVARVFKEQIVWVGAGQGSVRGGATRTPSQWLMMIRRFTAPPALPPSSLRSVQLLLCEDVRGLGCSGSPDPPLEARGQGRVGNVFPFLCHRNLCRGCLPEGARQSEILGPLEHLKGTQPQLVWLRGLSAQLQTKGSLARLPVRVHGCIVGQEATH